MQRLFMPTEQVGEMIEITYNIDIAEEKKGKVKIIKRNLPVKKLVAVHDIKNPTQIFDKKGKLIKNKCSILLKDEGEVIINKSYEAVKKLISETKSTVPQKLIGFKLKKDNR